MTLCKRCNLPGDKKTMVADSKRQDGFRPVHRKEYCGNKDDRHPSPDPNESVLHLEGPERRSVEEFLREIDQPIESLDAKADTPFVVKDINARRWMAPTAQGLQEVNYMSAKLVRRKPLELEIQLPTPVRFTLPTRPPKPRTQNQSSFKRGLIIPDTQFGLIRSDGRVVPFHDRRCLELYTQVIEDYRPDLIVHLGDVMDLPEFSDKFFIDPDTRGLTQEAFTEAAFWFSRWRAAAPYAKFVVLEGNHDERMFRAIGNKIPGAWKLTAPGARYPALSIPNLLGFEDLGIEYCGPYPNGEYYINNNCRASHGDSYRPSSGDSVKQVLQEARCSEIFGHVHRAEMASKTVWGHRGPVTYVAMSPGTAARLDGPIPRVAKRSNWQNGFGEIEYEEGNGGFTMAPVQIYSGECIFRGRKYTVTDSDVPELPTAHSL